MHAFFAKVLFLLSFFEKIVKVRKKQKQQPLPDVVFKRLELIQFPNYLRYIGTTCLVGTPVYS